MFFLDGKSNLKNHDYLLKAHVTIEPNVINNKLAAFLELYQNVALLNIDCFSLNYENEKPIKKLISTKVDAFDFESFIAYAKIDRYFFSFGRRFLDDKKTSVFEVSVCFPQNNLNYEDSVLELIKFISNEFVLIYGYCRFIAKNYSPVVEEKIKKSIFGFTSVHIKKFGSDWLLNPEAMLTAAIKGLYPYNFVNHDVLGLPVIKKIIKHPNVTIDSLNEEISCIKIPVEILPSLRKENRDIKDYIRD